MKLKELHSELDLERYRHLTAKKIGVLLPLDYLQRGQVYALIDKEQEICGGFALITQGPFRVLESIPDGQRIHSDYVFDVEKTAEITGLWLSRRNSKKYSSFHFWFSLIYRLLKSKKKYFVYAYTTKKTDLKNIYSKARPEILFCGITKILPGMSGPEHETVEVVAKSRILIQTFKNFDFFIRRMMIKNKKMFQSNEKSIKIGQTNKKDHSYDKSSNSSSFSDHNHYGNTSDGPG